MIQEASNFQTFYRGYLQEHSHYLCRRMHFVGTWLALVFILLAVWRGQARYLLCALVVGYAFAWIGHLFFEKNKPATFSHPIYSFIGDWVMFRDILLGRITI